MTKLGRVTGVPNKAFEAYGDDLDVENDFRETYIYADSSGMIFSGQKSADVFWRLQIAERFVYLNMILKRMKSNIDYKFNFKQE